jgi:hypothetical protein
MVFKHEVRWREGGCRWVWGREGGGGVELGRMGRWGVDDRKGDSEEGTGRSKRDEEDDVGGRGEEVDSVHTVFRYFIASPAVLPTSGTV